MIDTTVEPADVQDRAESSAGSSVRPVGSDRRRALARMVLAILAKAVPDPTGVALRLDDGPTARSGRPASASIRINGPDAVGRLIWPPTPDTFAEGYLRGDLDIDGDVGSAIEAAQELDFRRLDPIDLRRLVRFGAELRRRTPGAPTLRRTARLSGPRHSRARDLEAVRFHYDVGENFYRLWLDRRLTYSCGYFARSDDPATDLDTAQEAKLDLICRKLDLREGQRLLDIGCGWGSLVVFAAERYDVDVIGVTLSERQARETNRRAAEAGVSDRVRAEVRDYRDLADLGPFDAVASVGMFEHVGIANLPAYFSAAYHVLAPGGRFLNHGIASTSPRRSFGPPGVGRGSRFLERYVFPDGELASVEHTVGVARGDIGFELLDIQLLRPHYALTLRAWVERLEQSWEAAVAAAGEEVARTWRLYMSGARLSFEQGENDVAQVLLGRPLGVRGPAPRPLRPWW